MKVWFTRPAIWTCLVRGIGGCEVWVKKPFFDESPRGPADSRIFAEMPVGWRVKDEDGLDATGVLNRSLGKLLAGYDDVALALWNAMSFSICGQTPGDDWPDIWAAAAHATYVDDSRVDGHETFVFECEVPPSLWFRIALAHGANEIARSQNFRLQLWYASQEELPF